MSIESYRGKSLLQAFRGYLVQNDHNRSIKKKEERDGVWFYPSSFGQCERKIVYSMLDYEPSQKEAEDILVLDNGTYFHERMEDYFKEMGILVTKEMAFRDEELRVSGRTDAIVYDPSFDPEHDDPGENIILIDRDGTKHYEGPSNALMIVEFKSIKDSNFDKLRTKAKKNHVEQLQLYLHLTGIKKGAVWYENKNDQTPLVFDIVYDEKIAKDVVSFIQKTFEYVNNNELPERPFGPNDIPCRWCDYRNLCHPDSNPFDYEDLIRQYYPF